MPVFSSMKESLTIVFLILYTNHCSLSFYPPTLLPSRQPILYLLLRKDKATHGESAKPVMSVF